MQRGLGSLALSLTFLLGQPAVGGTPLVHYAIILPDGSIRLDGVVYKDAGPLRAALTKIRCGVKIELDKAITYDTAAKGLSLWQRAGTCKIGFVNVR
jgi:hypothetical protein